jgi:hypothetical protein
MKDKIFIVLVVLGLLGLSNASCTPSAPFGIAGFSRCKRPTTPRATPPCGRWRIVPPESIKPAPGVSVFEPRVFVPAFWARAFFGAAGGGVEMLATHAEKGGFATFVVEKRVIAAVIEYPHREEEPRDEKTIDDHDGDQIHAAILAAEAAGANSLAAKFAAFTAVRFAIFIGSCEELHTAARDVARGAKESPK